MAKLTLNDVGSLIDATTAKTTINNNNTAIEVAMEKTLSRDGTTPNTMSAPLDMNSQHILNLPAPVSANDPIRLQDLSTFSGGGTIATIPAGGSTNQPLSKNSNASYDVKWNTTTGSGSSVLATSPTLVTPNLGTPSTAILTNATGLPINTGVSGMGSNVATFLTTPAASTLRNAVVGATGVGNVVYDTGPSLNGPTLIVPLLGTPASGVLTNCTGTAAGLTAGNVTTNANLTGVVTSVGNATSFAASPTFVTPTLGAATATSINSVTIARGQILGEASTANASAGNIGEYVESVIVSGSSVSLVTSTPKTITSISLTAGDWDVDGIFYMLPANTTSVTQVVGSLSLATNTLDITPGRVMSPAHPSIVYTGATSCACPIPNYRFSLSSTTSIFLIGFTVFTVSTNSGFGIIRARRIR